MSGDIFGRLWLLAALYPELAIMLVVLLWIAGTFVAVAITSMSRPELPLHQWADDEEQARAVTQPAALPVLWGRSGGKL